MNPPSDFNEWTDHDPRNPSAETMAQTEASYLAAMASTPSTHPDADYLRKFQPLDLKACKDR